MIGRDDRRAAGRDQIAEQPQLGGEVMRHIRMIIHVVARQVGEAAGRDAHAVEPILVEPMRGGLEGQMRDAVARDFVELPVQRDRIRRRQRAVDRALRRNQSDGADAGGGVAEPLPDLAREGGNRSLAAGAGDGCDRCGLPRIKSAPRPAPARGADLACRQTARGARPTAHGRRRPQPRPPAIAESIKREPSVLLPASAKNRSPGFTARLSTARPLTSTASACGSIAASSLNRSRSLIDVPVRPAQLGARDLRLTGLSSMPQE